MRALLALSVVSLLAVASPARAQYGRGGDFEPEHAAHRDTTVRTLGGPWQLWAVGGVGWLGSPADVRKRYNAGLDVGAAGDRRFADRFALRARLDFDDLPTSQPDAVIVNGIAYTNTDFNFGHGWRLAATGGGAVRVWNHLWLEGEAGPAYFNSGLGGGDTFTDPLTLAIVPLSAGTGWGSTWGAGARYEFQPGRRDRVLAEVRFGTMDRHDVLLRFFAIRAGYRAF